MDLSSSVPVKGRVDGDHGALIACGLIAAAPALFALATWNPAEALRPVQAASRFISLPVLAVEATVLLASMRAGATPFRVIASQPAWIKVALAALLVIVAATTLLVAPNVQLALIRTFSTALHVVLALSLASLFALRWRSAVDRLWPMVVIGNLAFLLVIAAYVAAIPDPEHYDWERFWLAGTNVRQLGFYSCVGAAAALGLAAAAEHRRPFLMWTAAAALLLGLSFWSGTRSSLAAIAAAFVFGVATMPALRTVRFVGAAVGATAAGALLSMLHVPPHPLFGVWRMLFASSQEEVDEFASGRIEMWLGTLNAAGERPLFGHGAGQFRLVVPESGGLFNHPHNFPLQLLIEWGAVGAAIVLSIGLLMWLRFHAAAKAQGAVALPAFLAVNSLLALSMIEGALYHPWPVMMAAVGFAFVLRPYRAPPAAA